MSGDYKREHEGHKRESEGCKRESDGHKRESDGYKRQSGDHKRESEGHKRHSGDHKRESDGHKRHSEDRKREIRTQGKFSDMSKIKSQDKRQKSNPLSRELHEKKTHKRYSNESRTSNNSYTDEDSISSVKYQENSEYSFEQFDSPKKAIEIAEAGKHTLSDTENGESLIFYKPQVLEDCEADDYFERLYSSVNWHSKNIVINGEEFPQPRLVAWFGPYPYSYSGATLEPQDMTDCILEIKKKVEEHLSENGFKDATFNSVLLNLYRDGKDSVAWHSDDELTMGIYPTIASVSLGETRKFEMRFKKRYSDDENSRAKQAEFFVHLTHGSLIVMDGCMQDDWQHRVPKEYHDRDARINLTFRKVYPLEQVSHREHIWELEKKQVDECISNRSPSNEINFDDDNFPPLKSEDFTQSKKKVFPLLENKGFPPVKFNFQLLKSKDNSQPLKSEDDCPALQNDENFPLLKCEDNLLPLKSEGDSSPLNSDVNPTLSHPPSDDRDVSLNSSSNSSMRNDDLNRSYEHWDSEPSSGEIFKAENDKHNNDIHDNYFETIEVNKYAEKFVDDNDNSVVMEPVKSCGLGDSVSSSDITEEYVHNEKPSTITLNAEAKEFVPLNLLPYRPDYSKLTLSELIHYEVKLMCNETLQDFAYHLKNKIFDRLTEFSNRGELEFLCTISDGSQTEKNQKLITTRMINMVFEEFKRPQTFPHADRPYRHHRTSSYGKQNNVDRGRFRQTQGRPGTHRY